jgi:hypothetical protein
MMGSAATASDIVVGVVAVALRLANDIVIGVNLDGTTGQLLNTTEDGQLRGGIRLLHAHYLHTKLDESDIQLP